MSCFKGDVQQTVRPSMSIEDYRIEKELVRILVFWDNCLSDARTRNLLKFLGITWSS